MIFLRRDDSVKTAGYVIALRVGPNLRFYRATLCYSGICAVCQYVADDLGGSLTPKPPPISSFSPPLISSYSG